MKIVKVSIIFVLTISVIAVLIFYTKRWMMSSVLFHLRTIKISGNELVSEKTILSLIDIKSGIRIFNVNTDSLEKKLISNPFIKDVSVKRIFPSTISISIKEKRPIAFVISEQNYLLSESGEVLPMPEQIRVYDLPTVTGIKNLEFRFKKKQKIQELNNVLKMLMILKKSEINLYYEISEIYYRNNDTSILYLYENAIPAYINNINFEETFFLFKQFLAYLKGNDLLDKIKYINLCYKDQIITRE